MRPTLLLQIQCSVLALLLLSLAVLPAKLQAVSTGGEAVYPMPAPAGINSGTATIRDWDKAWDAFDFAKGQVCPGCGQRGGLPGDFFIGYGNGQDKRIHAFDSPGVVDMGNVTLASVNSAPASGYLDKAEPVEGHTYVIKSAGKFGKFRITDEHLPPFQNVAEWEIEWAFQPDGSNNLSTGATAGTVTPPTVTPPTVTPPAVAPPPVTQSPSTGSGTGGSGVQESYHGSPDVGSNVRMNYWHGQTFTALSSRLATGARLAVYRVGYPGSLIASIRATDASGHPAGADLAVGSTSGDSVTAAQSGEWREISFAQPLNMNAGVKYALVVRAPGGGGGNGINWLTDTTVPDYAGGSRESSGDNGASWQTDAASDYLFEIVGPAAGTTQAVQGGTSSGTTQPGGTAGQAGSSQQAGGASSSGGNAGVGGGYLPPGVWVPWPGNTSQWVTIGPEQICIDSTTNGYDMMAKTQRTYGTNVNYTVEFDFKTTSSSARGIRLWQDGFAFPTLWPGNTIVLYSGNYNSHEISKTQLLANQWYRIRIVATKGVNPAYPTSGKYDVYVDGQYVATMNSSEFDMIRECGGNCILIGKYSESILDRYIGCWKNITVMVGGSQGTPTQPSSGPGTGASTGTTTGTGAGVGASTNTGTGSATGAGTRLVAESRTASPGYTVLLPIRLENAQGMGSLGFTVTYDPAVLQFVRADKGAAIPSDASFVPNSPRPGAVILAFAGSRAFGGSGPAVQLEFKAVGALGSSSAVTISDVNATGSSGSQMSVSPVNGQVTIGQKTRGDGNGDGLVSVLDALMALKMYVKAIAEDLALDVNSDGKVTPEDARLILQMAKPK